MDRLSKDIVKEVIVYPALKLCRALCKCILCVERPDLGARRADCAENMVFVISKDIRGSRRIQVGRGTLISCGDASAALSSQAGI